MNRLKIETQSLCYSYSGRNGFRLDIDNFAPEPCSALTGGNGSGKTTLGKLLAGILRPQAGKVLYNGEDIAGWKLGKIGQRLGYLFQEPSRQIFAPTVMEELCFPVIFRGGDRQAAEAAAEDLLSEFGLSGRAESITYNLSRGEKQRLALASAFLLKPDFFILDEPTTGLDKRQREILAGLLKCFLEKGAGIMLISHDMDFIKGFDARIYRMESGRLYE